MATQPKTKPLDADTKVRIINNSNSKIHWIQLNGRPITLLKIGTPSTLPFIELENMAYTSDLIQTGDIYVQDKNVFDTLGSFSISSFSSSELRFANIDFN